MADALHNEILDILRESSGPVAVPDLLKAVPATSVNQLYAALVDLEGKDYIEMDEQGRYRPSPRRPRKDGNFDCAYLDQKTRPGGVMTSEGWIPYARHPSGWHLPVAIDADGRPIRKGGAFVFVCPDGTHWQPESVEALGKTLRAWP